MTETPPTVVGVTDLEISIPGGPTLLGKAGLTLRPGRITALTGPSGSGKSTLLRAVIGELPAGARVVSGTVDVLGQDVLALPEDRLRALRRHRVAYVGQDPGSALDPRMRVRHLVAETAADPSPRAVRDLLAECRLPVGDGLPDRRPGALSGGQQRRVALARALARRPDVLLLDEPTAGLDTALRDEIADLLRHLATSRGLAIVLACHDPALVERCADDVVDLGPAARTAPGPATAPVARPAVLPVSGAPGAGLAAEGVTVTFIQRGRNHRALAGADFAVAPGGATGVIGPSGSGKTTLLRVLAGLQRPDAGGLTLDGRALPALARRRGRTERRRVQLVPQNPLGALNPARTVGATLARPLRLHRAAARSELAGRVAGLLDQVGLPAGFARRYPHELSGGQRQRVSIARALAPGPDVLLCDEVTSALDPGTAGAVLELLTRLRAERGLALVLVSHELHLVAAHTDTVHVLEAGRVTATGDTRRMLPVVG
ncbi:ATP-binding cassette domain-containing protein [Streptomyces sp. HU2014]|uniref:ABC transporter ATP-binding protein n=1 Tax=Streptomyces albireticuli TaxID=1940 RepID=A0A1Z2KX93_9ACTN|nr:MULTISPECIES: ATP-binding cassette domain-containing protein [Streptomyces]ARZ66650.1 ABC transporter ATP-binding protein [Streptomyces albireticuli]UQI46883.1 ATP-binding cassette domain-containing protein [Streptomyces sp. HU2014]